MKSNILIIATLALTNIACSSTGQKWEYVRLESEVPDPNCEYKMQEACSQPANRCYNWHKQRAVKYHANTVVVTTQQNLDQAVRSGWTGNAKSGQNVSTIAEYYFCNGPKNLQPPAPRPTE